MSDNIQSERYFLINLFYKIQKPLLDLSGNKQYESTFSHTVIKKPEGKMVSMRDILSFLKQTEESVVSQSVVITGLYEFKSKEDVDTFFGQQTTEKLVDGQTNS